MKPWGLILAGLVVLFLVVAEGFLYFLGDELAAKISSETRNSLAVALAVALPVLVIALALLFERGKR